MALLYAGFWLMPVADGEEALAEHYAISRTPLARGLKVINTERATVPMRCVLYPESVDGAV